MQIAISEDFEEQDKAMAAALKARAINARLAKADDACGIAKRPAGKVGRPPKDGAVLKKPAAAALPGGFKVCVAALLTAKLAKASSRGAFTTRGSTLGKKQARDAGLSDKKVIEAGSIGYAACAKFWDDQK